MFRKKTSLLFLIMFQYAANAQSISFDVNSIPAEVKKNAAQVVRFENIELEITDISRAKLNVHKAITVLNEKGKRALFFGEATDKFISLEDVEIKLYDAAGKIIDKYKQKDLHSLSIADGLIDDSKMYFVEVPASNFPVTIEYKYEIRFKGTLNYPPYQILTPDEGIENSSCTVKIQKDLGLRYKEKNIHLSPSISDDGKYMTYTWAVKNISPIEQEEDAVSYESRYPSILLAPTHFKLDDYEGNMNTWQNFGMWYEALQKGAGELSADRIIFFKNLIKDAKNEREKVKLVYQYLQKNFRYVSIQLGIGGFKPFPASFTDAKKYGDCKALSNYMQAVLNSIGIKSYQALINAEYNKEPVDPSFPCNQFNHVILCVPQPKDSIWLECTSRTSDFGRLGSFTENRNALLITETGGILVPTPKSSPHENIFNARTIVRLTEDGTGKTTTRFAATGEYKRDFFSLMNEKADEQKNSIIYRWGFKDPDNVSFENNISDTNLVMVVVQEAENVTQFKTSTKMFLPLRIYNLWTAKLPKSENRREDFYFNCPFEKSDTTIFYLPDGYKIEALPEVKNTKCNYAAYSSKYWYDEKDRSIYSIANITLYQHKIPASDYAGVKKFFDDIEQNDLQRIIIKKE